jgi:hypothetical protein
MPLLLDLGELQKSYETAREQLLGLPDPVERDIGLGTLRLEAENTLLQLRQSSQRPSESELRSLTSYVESLKGGKISENAVKAIDKAAARITRDIWKSLLEMTAVGSVSLIFGLLVAYVGSSTDAGVTLANSLLTGAISVGVVAKVLTTGGPAGERAFFDSWSWATGLGHASTKVMAPVRKVQQRLLGAAVAATAYQPLAEKARLRALVLIALAWAGVAIGLCAFVYGVYEGFQAATAPTTPSIEFEP